METRVILIIILFILIIIFAILLRTNRDDISSTLRGGGHRSRFEERVVRVMENITGHPFNQAHPAWLKDDNGTILELDGYNTEMELALEVQGPGHSKPLPGESYEKYRVRVGRDILKHKLCGDHGVDLIAIDYKMSPLSATPYIQSRFYDFGRGPRGEKGGRGDIRPANYIKEIVITPWERGK